MNISDDTRIKMKKIAHAAKDALICELDESKKLTDILNQLMEFI